MAREQFLQFGGGKAGEIADFLSRQAGSVQSQCDLSIAFDLAF